jgi:hypothetical protein
MSIFQPAARDNASGFCAFNQGITVSNQLTTQVDLDDEDDDDDFEDAYGDMLGEEQWEDNPAAQKLYAAMPKGWVMVKCVNFTFRSMGEMERWLKAECRSDYKQVGFKTGCSYNVAVQFKDIVDATMFKLRWR